MFNRWQRSKANPMTRRIAVGALMLLLILAFGTGGFMLIEGGGLWTACI